MCARRFTAPHSRVAAHFLRTAEYGCRRATPSARLGLFPPGHPYSDEQTSNCTCVRQPPRFWWSSPRYVEEYRRLHAKSPIRRGGFPTEVCRCTHCSVLCPDFSWDNYTLRSRSG